MNSTSPLVKRVQNKEVHVDFLWHPKPIYLISNETFYLYRPHVHLAAIEIVILILCFIFLILIRNSLINE